MTKKVRVEARIPFNHLGYPMKLQDLVTSYLSVRLVRPPTARTYRYYVKRVTDHTKIDTPSACTIEVAIAFRDALIKTSKPVTWNSAPTSNRTLETCDQTKAHKNQSVERT